MPRPAADRGREHAEPEPVTVPHEGFPSNGHRTPAPGIVRGGNAPIFISVRPPRWYHPAPILPGRISGDTTSQGSPSVTNAVITESRVLDALRSVMDPDLGRD